MELSCRGGALGPQDLGSLFSSPLQSLLSPALGNGVHWGSAVSLSGPTDKGLSAVGCEGKVQRRGVPEGPFSLAVTPVTGPALKAHTAP